MQNTKTFPKICSGAPTVQILYFRVCFQFRGHFAGRPQKFRGAFRGQAPAISRGISRATSGASSLGEGGYTNTQINDDILDPIPPPPRHAPPNRPPPPLARPRGHLLKLPRCLSIFARALPPRCPRTCALQIITQNFTRPSTPSAQHSLNGVEPACIEH